MPESSSRPSSARNITIDDEEGEMSRRLPRRRSSPNGIADMETAQTSSGRVRRKVPVKQQQTNYSESDLDKEEPSRRRRPDLSTKNERYDRHPKTEEDHSRKHIDRENKTPDKKSPSGSDSDNASMLQRQQQYKLSTKKPALLSARSVLSPERSIASPSPLKSPPMGYKSQADHSGSDTDDLDAPRPTIPEKQAVNTNGHRFEQLQKKPSRAQMQSSKTRHSDSDRDTILVSPESSGRFLAKTGLVHSPKELSSDRPLQGVKSPKRSSPDRGLKPKSKPAYLSESDTDLETEKPQPGKRVHGNKIQHDLKTVEPQRISKEAHNEKPKKKPAYLSSDSELDGDVKKTQTKGASHHEKVEQRFRQNADSDSDHEATIKTKVSTKKKLSYQRQTDSEQSEEERPNPKKVSPSQKSKADPKKATSARHKPDYSIAEVASRSEDEPELPLARSPDQQPKASNKFAADTRKLEQARVADDAKSPLHPKKKPSGIVKTTEAKVKGAEDFPEHEVPKQPKKNTAGVVELEPDSASNYPRAGDLVKAKPKKGSKASDESERIEAAPDSNISERKASKQKQPPVADASEGPKAEVQNSAKPTVIQASNSLPGLTESGSKSTERHANTRKNKKKLGNVAHVMASSKRRSRVIMVTQASVRRYILKQAAEKGLASRGRFRATVMPTSTDELAGIPDDGESKTVAAIMMILTQHLDGEEDFSDIDEEPPIATKSKESLRPSQKKSAASPQKTAASSPLGSSHVSPANSPKHVRSPRETVVKKNAPTIHGKSVADISPSGQTVKNAKSPKQLSRANSQTEASVRKVEKPTKENSRELGKKALKSSSVTSEISDSGSDLGNERNRKLNKPSGSSNQDRTQDTSKSAKAQKGVVSDSDSGSVKASNSENESYDNRIASDESDSEVEVPKQRAPNTPSNSNAGSKKTSLAHPLKKQEKSSTQQSSSSDSERDIKGRRMQDGAKIGNGAKSQSQSPTKTRDSMRITRAAVERQTSPKLLTNKSNQFSETEDSDDASTPIASGVSVKQVAKSSVRSPNEPAMSPKKALSPKKPTSPKKNIPNRKLASSESDSEDGPLTKKFVNRAAKSSESELDSDTANTRLRKQQAVKGKLSPPVREMKNDIPNMSDDSNLKLKQKRDDKKFPRSKNASPEKKPDLAKADDSDDSDAAIRVALSPRANRVSSRQRSVSRGRRRGLGNPTKSPATRDSSLGRSSSRDSMATPSLHAPSAATNQRQSTAFSTATDSSDDEQKNSPLASGQPKTPAPNQPAAGVADAKTEQLQAQTATAEPKAGMLRSLWRSVTGATGKPAATQPPSEKPPTPPVKDSHKLQTGKNPSNISPPHADTVDSENSPKSNRSSVIMNPVRLSPSTTPSPVPSEKRGVLGWMFGGGGGNANTGKSPTSAKTPDIKKTNWETASGDESGATSSTGNRQRRDSDATSDGGLARPGRNRKELPGNRNLRRSSISSAGSKTDASSDEAPSRTRQNQPNVKQDRTIAGPNAANNMNSRRERRPPPPPLRGESKPRVSDASLNDVRARSASRRRAPPAFSDDEGVRRIPTRPRRVV
ncbi:hypothetical protein HDU83_002782 [Entophlyctis luteolus]|nr:hypothetical protein HDU83_002782 [Entophlyctis luteolus]